MAAHYGTAILPARPRRPRDKAKVEQAVLIVDRWLLGRLRRGTFYGLADVDAAIGELLMQLNDVRPIRRLATRAASFRYGGRHHPGIPGRHYPVIDGRLRRNRHSAPSPSTIRSFSRMFEVISHIEQVVVHPLYRRFEQQATNAQKHEFRRKRPAGIGACVPSFSRPETAGRRSGSNGLADATRRTDEAGIRCRWSDASRN